MPVVFWVHIMPLVLVIEERAVDDTLIPIKKSGPKLFMSVFPGICVYLYPAALIGKL